MRWELELGTENNQKHFLKLLKCTAIRIKPFHHQQWQARLGTSSQTGAWTEVNHQPRSEAQCLVSYVLQDNR